MRRYLLVGCVLFISHAAIAEDAATDWKLPEAEARQWIERLGPIKGWTIQANSNELVIEREKPVEMLRSFPNMSTEDLPHPDGESRQRIALRFAPKMSQEEFDRLYAINQASIQEQERLHKAVNLPHKFDQFVAITPEEKQRVAEYHRAVAKLPTHDLPDFYTPDYSIFYVHHWHMNSFPAELTHVAEWRRIEERLIRRFGMYDTMEVENRTLVGRFEPLAE